MIQHDYDLVKHARRRKLLESGISKASPRKRSTGGLRDDTFVRPISPAAMPGLIREAESELEKSFSGSDRFTTPVRANLSMASTSYPRYVDPSLLFDSTGPREWEKNDWKILDACFTDERLDLAEKMGMAEGSLADVTDLRLDDVVNRFTDVIGGDAVLATLGSSWTRLVFTPSYCFLRPIDPWVIQERHTEASSCSGQETEGRKRRAWDTPPISHTVFRDARA